MSKKQYSKVNFTLQLLLLLAKQATRLYYKMGKTKNKTNPQKTEKQTNQPHNH